MSGTVLRRAIGYTIVVGTVLNVINHAGCCLQSGACGFECTVQMVLTALVPFVVSTLSSTQAIMASERCTATEAGRSEL